MEPTDPLFTLPAAQSQDNMNTYKTSDLYCSAFLVASGVPMLDFERRDGKTTFAFAQKDGLSQLIEKYYADTIGVSPIRYGNSLKNLKAMIYSTNTKLFTYAPSASLTEL